MTTPDSDPPQELATHIKAALAARIGKPAEAIALEDDLLIDLGLDSLAIAELLAALEQHAQRSIPADQLLDVSTVGDLVQLFAHAGPAPSECEHLRN